MLDFSNSIVSMPSHQTCEAWWPHSFTSILLTSTYCPIIYLQSSLRLTVHLLPILLVHLLLLSPVRFPLLASSPPFSLTFLKLPKFKAPLTLLPLNLLNPFFHSELSQIRHILDQLSIKSTFHTDLLQQLSSNSIYQGQQITLLMDQLKLLFSSFQ